MASPGRFCGFCEASFSRADSSFRPALSALYCAFSILSGFFPSGRFPLAQSEAASLLWVPCSLSLSAFSSRLIWSEGRARSLSCLNFPEGFGPCWPEAAPACGVVSSSSKRRRLEGAESCGGLVSCFGPDWPEGKISGGDWPGLPFCGSFPIGHSSFPGIKKPASTFLNVELAYITVKYRRWDWGIYARSGTYGKF